MKKVLQTLGSGAQLSGRQNIPEGAYEYNKLFIECGIKAYVNSDITQKSYEEKYESLEILSKALNVLFEGYSLYEVSNKIEDQYIVLQLPECKPINAQGILQCKREDKSV